MSLAAIRARVDEARALGGEPLAIALIELAEAEPLFGHRQAAVRGPLEEAATLLDGIGVPELEGRVFLRLAHVKLSEDDLEAVEQLVARARDRLVDDRDRTLEALALLARSTIRRHDVEAAQTRLVEAGALLGDEPTTLVGRRTAALLAFAWVELALEQKQYADAESRLEVLSDLSDDDDDLVEIVYATRQASALVAFTRSFHARASKALRDMIVIAKRIGALEDELEARIALAGALVELGDVIARDEAEKHLQIVRDQAIEHGLESMHMAALIGQAGVLAKKGKTQGALSRCVELATAAVAKQDIPRYLAAVGLMSQIYEQKGDLASAYRTFAEAHAALKERIGPRATELFRPHLSALADRIGSETFREIAERVNKAAHARQAFRNLE